MVVLKTNRPEYRNDIAEEIRLFLGLVDIAETADACPVDLELTVTLYEQDGRFFAEASTADGRSYRTLADLPQQNRLEEKRQEKRALKIAVFRLLRQIYTDVSVPWGSLTGIRPTKLFRELTMRENAASAEEQFLHLFDVSPAKTELASRISSVQQPYIQSVRVDRDVDIYIGIPFCTTRCSYCSFSSVNTLFRGAENRYCGWRGARAGQWASRSEHVHRRRYADGAHSGAIACAFVIYA